jgi:hypothetical protein
MSAAGGTGHDCRDYLLAAEVKAEAVHPFAEVPQTMPRDQWLSGVSRLIAAAGKAGNVKQGGDKARGSSRSPGMTYR